MPMRPSIAPLAALLVLAAGCSDGGTEPKVIPAPVLESVTPAQVLVGSPDTTITLTGTGFQRESVARLESTGLATTYVSETELRARVPAHLLESGGAKNVAVFTLAVAKSSEPRPLTVYYDVPKLESLSHDTARAGQANPAAVYVNGSGFFFGTRVLWNGQPLTTLYQTPTRVYFIPPVTTAGTFSVAVQNPAPGGGTTASTTFRVLPAP